jgi:hypothetical protein
LEEKCLLSGTTAHAFQAASVSSHVPAVHIDRVRTKGGHVVKVKHGHDHAPAAVTTPPTTPASAPAPVPAPAPAPSPASALSLNQKVFTVAQSSLGTKVGVLGECTDLVNGAFAAAGAKAASLLGPTGADADYVWGSLIATITPSAGSTTGILPGDVIQFRDVTLGHTTNYPDGSFSWSTWSAAHHSAIVSSVSGTTINVIQQNVGDSTTPDSVKRTVQLGSFNLGDLQSGTMWVYRPIQA